jgi:hypothetical protein
MSPTLAAQASQAAAQGQQQLTNYNNQAADSKANYGAYQGQADAANNAVNSYTQGMQGSYDPNTGNGNAGSAYTYGLDQQLGKLSYDPNQMAAASTNLNQANGAASAYSDFANTGAAKFGLNAGGFAAANAGAMGQINNNIAAQQGVVGQLMDKYKTAQTGANQFAGLAVQGQHETLAGLQDVYTNAANSRDQAASMMNFYNNLAQQQGGMNAQQQQAYATAQQQYAAASQASAQAGYILSQTTGQNLQNQSNQAKLAASASSAQAKAQQTANAQAEQAYKNQGLTKAATTGNATGTPVYSAQF